VIKNAGNCTSTPPINIHSVLLN